MTDYSNLPGGDFSAIGDYARQEVRDAEESRERAFLTELESTAEGAALGAGGAIVARRIGGWFRRHRGQHRAV